MANKGNSPTKGAASHYFALPRGYTLFEFKIDTVLGHGGFGITYRSTDTLLQETVALKEYLPSGLAVRTSDSSVQAKSSDLRSDFAAGLKSFLTEARMMARFRHPRIVYVRRFFEHHGTGYIVLDYERGQTLGQRMRVGPLTEPELRVVLSGVLDGLEVLHNRAILHRDLKPNNIMLREDGEPVLIDFGAARDFQTRHSHSVTAIVTEGYSPPEQYGFDGQQGPWTDIYALGAIAYRCVTGTAPPDSRRRLRNDPLVPALAAAHGRYDESLLRTIDWMLKIDENERPYAVEQVREGLQGRNIPIDAQSLKPTEPPPPQPHVNSPAVSRPAAVAQVPPAKQSPRGSQPPPPAQSLRYDVAEPVPPGPQEFNKSSSFATARQTVERDQDSPGIRSANRSGSSRACVPSHATGFLSRPRRGRQPRVANKSVLFLDRSR